MKLLTKALRKKLPKLYETEEQGDDAIAVCKFFTPDSNWKWYVVEFDGEDTFFGLVTGFETELGYFTLSELKTVRGAFGLPIERDLYWEEMTVGEIKKRIDEGKTP